MIKAKQVEVPNNLIADIEHYENTPIQEKYLFHGTSASVVNSIINGKDVAFNITYSRGGMWGKGLYFAEMASYADGVSRRRQIPRRRRHIPMLNLPINPINNPFPQLQTFS